MSDSSDSSDAGFLFMVVALILLYFAVFQPIAGCSSTMELSPGEAAGIRGSWVGSTNTVSCISTHDPKLRLENVSDQRRRVKAGTHIRSMDPVIQPLKPGESMVLESVTGGARIYILNDKGGELGLMQVGYGDNPYGG